MMDPLLSPLPAWVQRNVPLAPLTTFGVGGAARWLARPATSQQVVDVLRACERAALDRWVLGGGSNVVIADRGLDGVVIQPSSEALQFDMRDDAVVVTAGAGLEWDRLVAETVKRELAGVECLSGIPGLCGAAPMQNIGAYGQQLSDVLTAAEVLDTRSLQCRWWTAEELELGYRDSALKRAAAGTFIVLSLQLRLQPGGPATTAYPDVAKMLDGSATLADVRSSVLAVRRRKGMVVDANDPDSRSAGSFFVNPVVSQHRAEEARARFGAASMPSWPVEGGLKLSAAWLIEQSGMPRGYGAGPVGLSTKHTLALVNRGTASSNDIVEFARHVQNRVHEASGIELTAEPRLLGFSAAP